MNEPHKIDPSRLTILEGIASRIHAEGHSLQDDYTKLIDERRSLNTKIRQLTDPLMMSNAVINNPSTKESVKSLDAKVLEISQQIIELQARKDQNREKWNAAARLKNRCADFLKDPPKLSPPDRHGSQSTDRSKWLDRPAVIQKARVPELPGSIPSARSSGGEAAGSFADGSASRLTGASQALLPDDDTRRQLDDELFERRSGTEEGR